MGADPERIGRLQERQEAGDPDLESDEIRAAIERAEQNRKELVGMQPAAKQATKPLDLLPLARWLAKKAVTGDEYRGGQDNAGTFRRHHPRPPGSPVLAHSSRNGPFASLRNHAWLWALRRGSYSFTTVRHQADT